MKNKHISSILAVLMFICIGNNKVISMNEEYEINYGSEGRVKFIKNPQYVAVKLHQEAKNEIEPLLQEKGYKLKSCKELGEFKILQLEDYENLDEKLSNIKMLSTVQTANAVYKTSEDENPFIPTGELYLKFVKDASPDSSTDILEKFNLEIVEVREEKEFIVKTTAKSPDPVKTAFELQQSKLIEVAEPDFSTLLAKDFY